jgi:hypothetical protein
MNPARFSFVVIVAGVSLFLLSVTASAQMCSNFCSDGVCIVDGILNVPLGNSSLEINNQCDLVVKGVGSSGNDGVIQPSLNSTVMRTELGLPNFSGSLLGTKAEITQHGVVDGKPNQEISVMSMVNFNGSDVRVSADCSLIQVAGYVIEIFSGLSLVGRDLAVDPPVLLHPKEDMIDMICGIEPNGNTFTSYRLRNPQPITIQKASGNLGPFIGNFVLLTGFTPKRVPSLQTDIHNLFTDAGDVVMTALSAGPLSTRCSSNAEDQAVGLPACNFDNPNGNLAPPFAAVLPVSRSVVVDQDATALVTLINPNTGSNATLKSCGVTVPSLAFANQFQFQTTDPSTNVLTGVPGTTTDIPPGSARTFAFTLRASAAVSATDVALVFGCENTSKAQTITGLNSFLFSASATAQPDIVALAATLNNDGIVNIPGINTTGGFAVATVNVGASGNITASADTGSASLPVNISLCQTDPATGQCISGISPSVTTQINPNATPTFGIFVQGNGNVSFDPAANRIFVRFKDGGGVTRGSTSVAVRTQ